MVPRPEIVFENVNDKASSPDTLDFKSFLLDVQLKLGIDLALCLQDIRIYYLVEVAVHALFVGIFSRPLSMLP